jgi:outer membrane lipoprotein SlyB
MKKLMCILTLAFGLTITAGSFAELKAQTTVKTKKKMSHRKKGALIGAGAGAVTGAVISKKKGKGAIIGGVVGATGGYLLGRHKDKKHPVTGTKTKIKTQ